MSVRVAILDGPLPPADPADAPAGAGAVLVFEGVVREREGDDPIDALEYRAYEPMAQRMLTRLGEELAARFGLLGVHVQHSRGRVGVGGCSLRVLMAAPHRKEALAAMDAFLDRLKRDVPIWKSPVVAGATAHRPSSTPATPKGP